MIEKQEEKEREREKNKDYSYIYILAGFLLVKLCGKYEVVTTFKAMVIHSKKKF